MEVYDCGNILGPKQQPTVRSAASGSVSDTLVVITIVLHASQVPPNLLNPTSLSIIILQALASYRGLPIILKNGRSLGKASGLLLCGRRPEVMRY